MDTMRWGSRVLTRVPDFPGWADAGLSDEGRAAGRRAIAEDAHNRATFWGPRRPPFRFPCLTAYATRGDGEVRWVHKDWAGDSLWVFGRAGSDSRIWSTSDWRWTCERGAA